MLLFSMKTKSAVARSSNQNDFRLEITRAEFDHILKAGRVLRVIRAGDLTITRYNCLKRRYWAISDGTSAVIFDAGDFRKAIEARSIAGDKTASLIARAMAEDSLILVGPDKQRHRYTWYAEDVVPPAHILAPARQMAGGMPL